MKRYPSCKNNTEWFFSKHEAFQITHSKPTVDSRDPFGIIQVNIWILNLRFSWRTVDSKRNELQNFERIRNNERTDLWMLFKSSESIMDYCYRLPIVCSRLTSDCFARIFSKSVCCTWIWIWRYRSRTFLVACACSCICRTWLCWLRAWWWHKVAVN
jgi:hypothetical protein